MRLRIGDIANSGFFEILERKRLGRLHCRMRRVRSWGGRRRGNRDSFRHLYWGRAQLETGFARVQFRRGSRGLGWNILGRTGLEATGEYECGPSSIGYMTVEYSVPRRGERRE
jgi:hypothetical protein